MDTAKTGFALGLPVLLGGLAACAARPTMAEMEQEASKTGDWSAVERREAQEDKARLETTTPVGPEHLVNICVKQGPSLKWSSVPPTGLNPP